jgi:hypothetical protein
MTPLQRQIADLFCPLADFYSSHGAEPPRIRRMAGADLPLPYRDLLVHRQDMTSTLEAFIGATLHVRVLEKQESESHLTRQVVLVSDDDGSIAEFGAIRIQLGPFEPAARAEILACRFPLGTILNRHGITYVCRPTAYFVFESDEIARRAFGLDGAHTLYGRHNLLLGLNETMLAEVVEILPPLVGRPR